jgi:hypothetical protein
VPRVYVRKGDRRRGEAITSLFTKEEKERVAAAALSYGLPMSIYVHRVVIASIGEVAA